jgi:N-acetylglucosamine-6-sulfatase
MPSTLHQRHVVLISCLITAFLGCSAELPEKPNLLFILTDDQRHDALSVHDTFPWLETPNLDALAAEGVLFENAFVTTSLCSPSRASFLTGTYANRHGVVVNSYVDPSLELRLFPAVLQEAGYETAYIGKWHMNPDDGPRAGFDHWVSFSGQGKYFDCKLNINGISEISGKYITDELTDRTIEFLRQEREKPFALYLSHKAVHGPFTPPPRHEGLYADVKFESLDNPDDEMSTKPAWLREQAAKRRNDQPKAELRDEQRAMNMLRSISAVDEGVGRIVEELRQQGSLDSTAIVFAGDNGYFYGEHGGLGDKRKAYEPSMRIPILMRYPPLAKPGTREDALVLNIDLAPTFLELAGARTPSSVQGMSWVGLLRGEDAGRDSFLYEYYEEISYRPTGGYGGTPTILAVRDEEWKYITYPELENEIEELYHVAEDPEELKNLAADPDYGEELVRMQALLKRQMDQMSYRKPVAPRRIEE